MKLIDLDFGCVCASEKSSDNFISFWFSLRSNSHSALISPLFSPIEPTLEATEECLGEHSGEARLDVPKSLEFELVDGQRRAENSAAHVIPGFFCCNDFSARNSCSL